MTTPFTNLHELMSALCSASNEKCRKCMTRNCGNRKASYANFGDEVLQVKREQSKRPNPMVGLVTTFNDVIAETLNQMDAFKPASGVNHPPAHSGFADSISEQNLRSFNELGRLHAKAFAQTAAKNKADLEKKVDKPLTVLESLTMLQIYASVAHKFKKLAQDSSAHSELTRLQEKVRVQATTDAKTDLEKMASLLQDYVKRKYETSRVADADTVSTYAWVIPGVSAGAISSVTAADKDEPHLYREKIDDNNPSLNIKFGFPFAEQKPTPDNNGSLEIMITDFNGQVLEHYGYKLTTGEQVLNVGTFLNLFKAVINAE